MKYKNIVLLLVSVIKQLDEEDANIFNIESEISQIYDKLRRLGRSKYKRKKKEKR